MNGPPLVSIVTPSFNQGRFLRRTIDSVLNQTYPHVEYLVVDGGSTDDSVRILESYGHDFWWVSEPDAGQADAINKGFARCRGSLRAYLNSDDVLMPGAVERAVAYFDSHPGWDLLYGRAYHIDAEDRRLAEYPTAPFALRRLVEASCICQPAAFWRTELAARVGPFNPRLDYCLDFEYWLRAARAGAKMVHVDDVLALSRLHPQTKTISKREQVYLEGLRVCQEQVGYVPHGPFLGLWRHRSHEQPTGWAGMLGRVPGSAGFLALAHRLWWRISRLRTLSTKKRRQPSYR
jgi:GT2 family glycosyltransferase